MSKCRNKIHVPPIHAPTTFLLRAILFKTLPSLYIHLCLVSLKKGRILLLIFSLSSTQFTLSLVFFLSLFLDIAGSLPMRERKLIVFHGETLTASVQPLVRVSASSVLLKLSAVLSAPGRPTYVLVLSRPTEINRDRAWNLFVWDSSIRRWRKSCLTGARGLNSEILGTSREKGHPEATGNLPGSSWRLFASKLD